MATDSVSKLLGDSADLKPVTQRLERIKRLQRRYRTLAPEQLAAASRVCAIDGTTIVICANSGAIAAALRHLAPRLLEGLRDNARKPSKQAEDQELTSIRIEVQVAQAAPKRARASRGEMPRERLGRLAQALAESPLKQALERIAEPDQIKRTRSKT